jgi:ketosteroid isomerase-like protein
MKRCPTCQSVYTDDSLAYCLQDGAKLAFVRDSASEETWQMSGASAAPPTEILKPEDMPTVRIEPGANTREQQRARPTALNSPSIPPPSSATAAPRSNATVILLSAVVAILLLVLGGLITWVAMRDRNANQQSTGNTTSNENVAGNTRQSNTTTRTESNTNSSQTPTPQPSAVDVAAAQKEVQAALNAWSDTIRQRNLEEHMKYYADTLDVYYNSANVSRERVRADRAAAFSKYNSLDMQLTNVNITIEPTGTRAVATFDKTFDFRGDEKDFSGSGLNRFWLAKSGGRWRITGEKDLKTYYVNK